MIWIGIISDQTQMLDLKSLLGFDHRWNLGSDINFMDNNDSLEKNDFKKHFT